MTLVILYEELAPYFLKCVSSFVQLYNVDVHIINREVNKVAPFSLEVHNFKTYKRSEYTDEELIELVKSIQPNAIFCCGWASKVNLKIIAKFYKEATTIVGFDNKWKGSLKQWVASIFAGFFFTKKFDYCFVPGEEQKVFAQKMGFKDKQIVTGVYCCDYDFFKGMDIECKEAKKIKFPKRFIYVGRYVENKGIADLWQAFIELQIEYPNQWELWCLGTGDVKPIDHPKIKHFGFVQPEAMKNYIRNTGVFVLPSHFEPWGVVVHEFASAGFPIICSDKVGARTAFVENNYNGYIYESNDISALKVALMKIINSDNKTLFEMGEKSVEKAKQITPDIWAKQLISLLK